MKTRIVVRAIARATRWIQFLALMSKKMKVTKKIPRQGMATILLIGIMENLHQHTWSWNRANWRSYLEKSRDVLTVEIAWNWMFMLSPLHLSFALRAVSVSWNWTVKSLHQQAYPSLMITLRAAVILRWLSSNISMYWFIYWTEMAWQKLQGCWIPWS